MKTLYKMRGGFGFWRWVHIRKCSKCQKEHHIMGNKTNMKPSLPPGAMKCEHCDGLVHFQ